MKAPVQLHQLAKVRFAFPPLPIRLAPPLSLPQPGLPHPSSQRLGMHFQSVITGQVLGRQRRPEIAAPIPHPAQYASPKLLAVGAIGSPPAVAMLQSLAPPPRYRAQIRLLCR
ncbi:MAG: hypothetical protein ABR861_11635 [Terriglobales bacterium]